MKSRIVILLSVTLVALLLVVGVVPKGTPTSPAIVSAQQQEFYQYTAPFTCGTAITDKEGVKPANYATTVTIHNPNHISVMLQWKVVRLFPNPKVSAFTSGTVDTDEGFCIRCKQICTKLSMAFPPPKYINGYVVIRCSYPLDVYSVLTTESDTGLSIDAECIYPSEFEWYEP